MDVCVVHVLHAEVKRNISLISLGILPWAWPLK